MADNSLTGSPKPSNFVSAMMNLLDIESDRKDKTLHTGEPCTVLAYKPPSPGASGTPLPPRVDVTLGHIRTKRENLPDGTEIIKPFGTTPAGTSMKTDCPILFPGISAQFMMLPDAVGSSFLGGWGWLCPNTYYPAPTVLTGQPSVSHLPQFRHSVNNGFFIPLLLPGSLFPQLPGSEPGKIKLGDVNGLWSLAYDMATQDITLTTTGPSVTLDATAEVKVGGLAVLRLVTETLISVMDTAIGAAIAGAVPQDGGKIAFTAFQTAWNAAKNTILTTKAKGE